MAVKNRGRIRVHVYDAKYNKSINRKTLTNGKELNVQLSYTLTPVYALAETANKTHRLEWLNYESNENRNPEISRNDK